MTIDFQLSTNTNRIGNFTSSEIAALITTGKSPDTLGAPAHTYIHHTNMERILGRSIDTDADSKATAWGKHMETYVFREKLGISYTYTTPHTDIHPQIDYWAGTKDGTNEEGPRAIIDLKNPYTLKSFMQLILPLHLGKTGLDAINAIRDGFSHDNVQYPKHKDGEKYYWQLVSNACISNTTHAELIIHMPRHSELARIKAMAYGNPALNWLTHASDEDLPYLPDDSPIPSLHIIRFEVPEADKEHLTAAVKKAGALLVARAAV